jgi:aspartyl-tRNA(Asn)/glutamyl-tRNA(Gln) amidotransferase subunit C
MKVTDELVDRLAELAKLEFVGQEKENIKQDMTQILEFVNKLDELNLDKVEPLIYISDEANILRNDIMEEHVSHELAMSNVPLKNSDYIKVPKVIKK